MSSAIDFMNSMRDNFGDFAFRAANNVAVVTSTNWPASPSHPANQPDEKFVIPVVERKDDGDDDFDIAGHKTRARVSS